VTAGGENYIRSPDIIRMIKSRRVKWVRNVTHMGEIKHGHKVLVGKPEWKRPLRSARHRCEDNININVGKVSWRVWMGFIWLRIGTSIVRF
jgi:hypothetical protein